MHEELLDTTYCGLCKQTLRSTGSPPFSARTASFCSRTAALPSRAAISSRCTGKILTKTAAVWALENKSCPTPDVPEYALRDKSGTKLLQNSSLHKKCTKNRPQKEAKQLLLGPILFIIDRFLCKLLLRVHFTAVSFQKIFGKFAFHCFTAAGARAPAFCSF